MKMVKQLVVFCFVVLGTVLFSFSATAEVNSRQSITIDAVVGEKVYYEFYRDNNHIDGVGFLAKRDGGDLPDWLYVWDSTLYEYANPRYAFLSGVAETVGEWTFRVSVFENQEMSKHNNLIFTTLVTLRVNPANHSQAEANPPSTGDSGYILCETLSARSSPDASSNLMFSLTYGNWVQIMQKQGAWYQIIWNGKRGWVRNEYVLINPEIFYPYAETAVYALPDKNAKRVGLLSASDIGYPIISQYGDFWVISLRGACGFVEK